LVAIVVDVLGIGIEVSLLAAYVLIVAYSIHLGVSEIGGCLNIMVLFILELLISVALLAVLEPLA
jgi:hypothetical protein